MKLFFCSLALLATCFCEADISSYLKKDTAKKTEKSPIKNIDFIYLINLDQRPEKLTKSLEELKPYKIQPHRFSAVNGWGLSTEEINATGVKFSPGMRKGEWAAYFSDQTSGNPKYDFLKDDSYGKTFFFRTMTPGTIGCSLSHLSVLQDAYDSGYQTIWVMEDDIAVKQDPHNLSSLIKKLDALVGKDGWDILYTDNDAADAPLYNTQQNFEKDLTADLWFFSRPDMDLSDRSSLAKRIVLSEDFVKIGSRMRTHSMLIRRSGMKKILDFEKQRHLFIPYDHELAIIPGIRMFNLRYDVVTHQLATSDTHTNPNVAGQASNSDPQEMFLALYNYGLQQQAEDPDAAIETFCKAYAMRPTRAEPLFQCAKIFREKGNFLLGYLLAKHAISHPYPSDDAHIEFVAYDHAMLIEFANCALLLGKFNEGFDACVKLLANPNLPEEYRSRIQSNYELARARLGMVQPSPMP